jgi:hypothetical protein
MKKFLAGIILLGLLIANPTPADEGVTPMLKMDTTYHFMWLDPMIPAAPLPGRPPGTQWALVWEGTIQGDVNGVIRWWAEFAPPILTGVGRWEIWDCEPLYPIDCNYDDPALLIMAGYDAFGYVSPTDWEGKGIVTYANEQYAQWFGRRITDGGWVEFDAPTGFPIYGEGLFVIYNRPSNKH